MASTCWPTASTELLGRTGGPAWLVSHGLASVIAIAILTYFHIVIGEMVPKSLALQRAETDGAADHAADAVDHRRWSIRSSSC